MATRRSTTQRWGRSLAASVAAFAVAITGLAGTAIASQHRTQTTQQKPWCEKSKSSSG